MTKNSKNHDESLDKHYTFFKTSESSGTKNRTHAKSPLTTRNFFQHLSNPFGTFLSIRQKTSTKSSHRYRACKSRS